jgi:biotin carboxylase
MWDRRHLVECPGDWMRQYVTELVGPADEDCAWDFDFLAFLRNCAREAERKPIDGVFSSSDYPGATFAAALAQSLGLAGSDPQAVTVCAHKFHARKLQRQALPELTPRFALVDPAQPSIAGSGLEFPCFVKPVKGSFSVLARRVESARELTEFCQQPVVADFFRQYVHMFNAMVREYTTLEPDGGYFIAEEVLSGDLVTVEGFARARGDVEVLGVVDSIVDERTQSFLRFEYPSALGPEVQERMARAAQILATAFCLRQCFFNLELFYDAARDAIRIVELNPRICGQFADLYEKVDGTNSYETALALASGASPSVRRRCGAHRAAASFPLRVFEPVRVRRAPSAERVREVEAMVPGTLVWTECETGQELADFESYEDGRSCRYGVVNVGAEDRAGLLSRFEAVRAALGFELEPLRKPGFTSTR